MKKVGRQEDCWRRIGVRGDGSCERLVELIHCRNCPVYAGVGKSLFDREAPPDYLVEWQARLAQEVEAEPVGTISVLMFRVGREWFALATDLMERVTAQRPVKRVPHRSNAVFAGLVNIEGELLLSVVLAAVLDVPPEAEGEPAPGGGRLLVVARDGRRWALVVDEVEGVVRVPLAAVSDPPVSVAKSPLSFSTGVIAHNGHSVALLNDEAVFRRMQQAVGG